MRFALCTAVPVAGPYSCVDHGLVLRVGCEEKNISESLLGRETEAIEGPATPAHRGCSALPVCIESLFADGALVVGVLQGAIQRPLRNLSARVLRPPGRRSVPPPRLSRRIGHLTGAGAPELPVSFSCTKTPPPPRKVQLRATNAARKRAFSAERACTIGAASLNRLDAREECRSRAHPRRLPRSALSTTRTAVAASRLPPSPGPCRPSSFSSALPLRLLIRAHLLRLPISLFLLCHHHRRRCSCCCCCAATFARPCCGAARLLGKRMRPLSPAALAAPVATAPRRRRSPPVAPRSRLVLRRCLLRLLRALLRALALLVPEAREPVPLAVAQQQLRERERDGISAREKTPTPNDARPSAATPRRQPTQPPPARASAPLGTVTPGST